MTSVLGLSMPKLGMSKQGITSPKNLALGGIAASAVATGGILGMLKGSPLKGLAIGAALAAAAVGAALVGTAGRSSRDGYCDYYGDPDCDYPSTDYPRNDPYYPRDDYPRNDYPRNDYPTVPGDYYPAPGTSRGDDY